MKIVFVDELAYSKKQGGGSALTTIISKKFSKNHESKIISFTTTPFKFLNFILNIPYFREIFVFPFFGLYLSLFNKDIKEADKIIFSSPSTALFFSRKKINSYFYFAHCIFSRQIKIMLYHKKNFPFLYNLIINKIFFKIFIFLENMSYKNFRTIMIPRKEMISYVEEHNKVKKDKLKLISQAINCKLFKNKKNKSGVLFVGRPTYMKGYDIFINCAIKNPKIKFTIISPKNYIEKNNLKNLKIIVRPSKKTIINEYSKAKFFLMPSRNETGPMVTLEAMISGAVCVCSKHGAGDFIDDKDNGIICNENDEFANILPILNKDVLNCLELSKKASSKAKKEFCIDGMYKKYLNAIV